MHDSKICFKCGESQLLTEFYKHSGMADGHLGKCKGCTKKDTKDNITKNHDYYLEYDRTRATLPHRKAANKLYSQTDEGKAVCRKAKAKWAEANVIKRAAQFLVRRAIVSGKLTKATNCEDCGIKHDRLHGHHDDYNYPLMIRYLCPKCHSKWHKINGSGENG